MAESRIAVYGAIAANVAIAVTKFVVAGITGSSAMLSEGIHSAVDTFNGVLLLVGIRLSQRQATPEHPFGHGKELYFWSLIVAVLIFGLGGGVSFYEACSTSCIPSRCATRRGTTSCSARPAYLRERASRSRCEFLRRQAVAVLGGAACEQGPDDLHSDGRGFGGAGRPCRRCARDRAEPSLRHARSSTARLRS